MAKQLSRVLTFEEPHDARLLVPGLIAALNGKWEAKYDRDALIELVHALQNLEEEWSNKKARFERDRAGFTPSRAIREPWRKICEILREYIAHPTLTLGWQEPDEPIDGAWNLSWTRADGKAHLDLDFALDAMETFKAGKISSLKPCQECGKWIIARFPHQRFCSGECKDRFHTTNEADKARRREWARENYQTRKVLESGSRKATKRKGGKR
jgi:hypothetical protein